MLPNQLSILSVLALPRNSVLYKVTDGTMKYVLKASRYPLAGEKEAFSDEYHTMVKVSHPVLPKYYDYFSDLNRLLVLPVRENRQVFQKSTKEGEKITG